MAIARRGDMGALYSSIIPSRLWRSTLLLVAFTMLLGCSNPDALDAYYAGDFETAHDLWVERASLGDTQAQTNLGTMYLTGIGVEREPERAFQWYRKAALAGNASAQRNLATMYQTGNGIEKDNELAYGWYHSAAEQGNELAQNYILAMTGDLTPNQIMRARERVKKELDIAADKQ